MNAPTTAASPLPDCAGPRPRVGIVTFHDVPNYGAALQACGLYRFLSSLGVDVRIIDHVNPAIAKYYRISPLGHPLRLFARYQRARRIRRFVNSRTLVVSPEAGVAQLDYLVCGSDQVWSTSATQGFDPAFFLDFSGAQATRISYAPSANQTDSFGPHRHRIRELLGRFEALSVRDRHTQALLQSECELASERVLDPVFLADFAEDTLAPAQNTRYVLVYMDGGMNPAALGRIAALTKRLDLPVFAVGNFHGAADRRWPSAGVDEWLGLFADAEHIITNSFHGVAFSLKLRRQFSLVLSPNKRQKVEDLLTNVALADKCAESGEVSAPVDYAAVARALTPQIEASKAFLRSAILASPRSR